MPAAIVVCPNCGKKNRTPAVAEGAPRCGNCHQPLPWIVDATASEFDGAIARLGARARRLLGALVRTLPDGLAGRRGAGARARRAVEGGQAQHRRRARHRRPLRRCRASRCWCSCATARRSTARSARCRPRSCAPGSTGTRPRPHDRSDDASGASRLAPDPSRRADPRTAPPRLRRGPGVREPAGRGRGTTCAGPTCASPSSTTSRSPWRTCTTRASRWPSSACWRGQRGHRRRSGRGSDLAARLAAPDDGLPIGSWT